MFEITAGQGSALSGLFTATGAILGILIAGKFFQGKVKNLGEALDTSKQLLEQHASDMSKTLATITNEVNVLKAVLSSIGEQSSRIESNTIAIEESSVSGLDQVTPKDAVAWEEFRETWFNIRDRLESIANAESLDGRRRAAYGRIDRRSYYDLIDRLEKDGELRQNSALMFRSALEIWHSHKNGRKPVGKEDLRKMRAFGETPL